ncbi:MAG: DUF4339 domain-containing protein [Bacteroidia bacterium]|nr:DUF4339 domain-containing protein [Bacteroidia bacterium]
MSSYLLLRNNKQSGPLSKEQLIQLGIKPYDLVWVEGKSAAWRYPGEVSELKDYAPMVEEQPYDRFYKKRPEEQIELVPEVANVNKLFDKPEEARYAPYTPNKKVSIVMPKQAEHLKEEDSFHGEEPQPADSTIAPKREEVETKYSQSLDEIKDMYVKQLQQRKHKSAQSKFIKQNLKKAAVFIAVFIAVIGCGILIGLALKPKSSDKKNADTTLQQNIPAVTNIESSKEEEPQTDRSITESTDLDQLNQQLKINKEVLNNNAASDPLTVSDSKKSIDEKNEILVLHPTAINTGNTERNKTVRNDDSKIDPDIKSNATTEDLLKLVSVKSNDYKLRSFGGFLNLELTVNNDSRLILENVVVELQYLKLNDQPAKVEHIRFQSISPGGSLTIRIPDNNRGAKLTYKIIKVEPKDFNSTTAGL